ncbi:glycosyltransferase family 4 protein [Hufsiella ginkgonis]|uniref:Glycosyltransferase n=1 Tax=Hufsiella ginkgonis TaxID=2695274 RepID=A0A7K1XXR0_9SPHI|nr:glycosyltransferase family 4 protein [Hufsiella ginkgonis]MXV15795.1 glycosyltransferase [Hufsiella ginkgonis]
MNKLKILFSMPSQTHVEIAVDEIEGLRDHGYDCDQFPFAAKDSNGSQLSRIQMILKNAFNLVKVAYRFQPDVIYLNSRLEVLPTIRDFLTIVIFKASYHKKVRFFLKSHGSDLEVLESKNFLVSKITLPYLRKNISGWLFLSTEERNKVAKNGYLSPKRIFVTKNIVRTNQFKIDSGFRTRLNIPLDHKILLFSGRIIREKGIYEVIEAFSQIGEGYKTTLIVVGGGGELENIKGLASVLAAGDRVIFTGFIPEPEVVEFYANSDILVFPTYFPEGFSMALFNSVGAGLAIITTPTRAATDFLSDPENCIWVKSQDSGSVANALNTLLGSEKLMRTMKTNNIMKARLFSKEQVSSELSEIIEL